MSAPFFIYGRERCGLFSIVFQVLALACRAEQMGTTAVVYLGREVCFWSETGYNERRNAWEYFFEPISQLKLEDIGLSTRALEQQPRPAEISATIAMRTHATNTYLWDEIGAFGLPGRTTSAQLQHLIEAARRYLRVRPVVLAKADAFREQHFRSSKIVGVHYRGTDKRRETPLIRQELYEQALDSVPSEWDQIFVATDSAPFLTAMRHRYGARVAATEAARSVSQQPVHFTGGASATEQGLVDALLLSRCGLLVHGPSNLPGGAILFNPTIPRIDLCLR